MTHLPIAGNTGMIDFRQLEHRRVFVFQDIAKALGVESDLVRRQYSRNAEGWNPDETGLGQIDPGATQEKRWFTVRGAMRFCRVIKSGNSDMLFDHLLDLFERDHMALATPAGQIPIWAENILTALSAKTLSHETRVVAVETKTLAIEAQVEALAERVEPEQLAAAIDAKIDDRLTIMEIRERQATHFNNQTTRAASQYVDKLMGPPPIDPLKLAQWKKQRQVEFHEINRAAKEAAFGTPRARLRNPEHARLALLAVHERCRAIGLLTPTIPEVARP